MKKWTLLVLAMILAFGSLNAQNQKMKIAVMDFKAGVGVNANEVEGLSDMLINTLYETKKFNIIERSQLNQVLKEQKFQSSDLSNEKLAQIGRILGVESILIGTVNFLSEHKNIDGSYTGEYNVDVRAVDVETGEILTTAGATKSSNSTYRAMMEKIGKQLAANLMDNGNSLETKETKKPQKDSFRKTGFALRPELGFVYGGHKGEKDAEGLIGPTANLALGYQLGSHIFIGGIVGYEGHWWEYYTSANNHLHDQGSHYVFAIMGDIRWYPINHKKTFVIDGRLGVASDGYTIGTFNAGFAFGNLETTVGVGGYLRGAHYCLNLSYRFGTNTTFKDLKWW